ncbi:PREDICTED: regulator of G-protein signaling protein-like [Charadrius vociferus]|uniref:regulator of G-protein signaling protein-like n=1 Tax=Charadrius vociferus TaxID=50402 RepID=UPI00052141E4|nr:PREDICTED: regulator of G-protein signaling protein-like [Charadrius vociferus]
MTAAATIASTDMRLLLRDDVFVDFFNTFLNLPVFGQTPIYISSMGRWDLWPELPSCLPVDYFKLRHHFAFKHWEEHKPFKVLVQLMGSIQPSVNIDTKLLNWQSADRWLLEKCISGSQGMWNFRAFVQGMAGEELTNFWLITERLLGLDESDTRQRDLYLSLLHRLKATYLREGSSVVTLCRTIVGSLPKATHIQPVSTRREILSKMQEQALFMIQSYWLPKFFIHCKKGMEEEKSCWPLLQEYRERLLQANSQKPSDLSENLFTMHIKKTQGLSGPYCSKKAKAEIWTLVKERKDTQEMKMSTFQLPSLKKPVKTLSFLPWALSAESCAGRPFRDFLKRQDCFVETRLLDLWHDLEEFLPVALDPNRENGFFLRHLMGEKICKTYLEEGTIQQLPLETRTLRSLRDHLMSGEFSPCIFRAQKEICKVLCRFYEEFLADDDRTFLQFMSPQSDVPMPKMEDQAVGKGECFLLSQRINASLKLSQALHGTRNLEVLSAEHWQLIAARDARKGSSIQAEVDPLLCRTDSQKTVSNELAVDSPSKEKELLRPKSPSFGESSLSRLEVGHFVKVLHNPAHLQFFKQFLEERNADEPLRFWMAVEKLVSETNPKTKSSLINSIVRNYFHAEIPAEEQLDCHISIIKDINEAEVVSPFMLMTAQIFVQQAMEKRWFKEYQDLFPPSNMPKSNLRLKHGTGSFTTDKLRWAWYAIRDIVKSISKFQREMDNDKQRAEFEDFLRRELGNEEENLPISSTQSGSTTNSSRSHAAPASTSPDKEVVLVKRQLFNSQLITVNFLVNDLHFYLEINKFSRLADSVEALAAHNVQSEKEVAFLKRKAAIISKLFLNSDIPPKLRVNISEEERDLIWSLSSKGLLNRVLYHRAKVIIFPILMHFWRRYLSPLSQSDEELSGLHKGQNTNLFTQYKSLGIIRHLQSK